MRLKIRVPKKRWLLSAGLILALVGVACGGGGGGDDSPAPAATSPPDAGTTPDPTPKSPPTPEPVPTLPAGFDPVRYFDNGFGSYKWKTDFSKFSVNLREIISGGPPRNGIPAITNPKFLPTDPSPDWLKDTQPVISLELNGEARAYPLQILIQHEIVNDVVGGVPVLITFCPLCNTAIAFDRTVDGEVLEFGTSGFLRFSDLIMWDTKTESFWQQITGGAIVGEMTGKKLKFLPAPIVSWEDFRTTFPNGVVLSRDTGFIRNYDKPPYRGYDEFGQSPFLYRGPDDPRLPPNERVITVSIGDEDVAYPFTVMAEVRIVNDTVGGQDVAVFWSPGTQSAFDNFEGIQSEIGASGVFDPHVDGQKLTFRPDGDKIVDVETGSQWNVLGLAVSGSLEGTQLEPILHANHFWFSWAVFKPDTRIFRA